MVENHTSEGGGESSNSERIKRRTYLGAVAGSVLANTTTVTAQEADLKDIGWLEDMEKYTYKNASFEVRNAFVQDSFFYQSMPDTVKVRDDDRLQYLFANLQFESADTNRPPFSNFAFIVENKRYESEDSVDQIPLFAITEAYRERMGQTYHTEPMKPPKSAVRLPPRYKNPIFTIGFALPRNFSAEQFGLGIVPEQQVDTGWKFDGEVVHQLQTSPEFKVLSIDGPDQIKRGSPVEISVAVKNIGQRSGMYRATVGHQESDHKKKLAVRIPAGKEATQTMELEYPPAIRQDVNGGPAVYQVRQDNAVLAEQEISVEVN